MPKTTEYICPIHGKIGDEWAQETIRFGEGELHCIRCLRDLMADKLPVVQKQEKEIVYLRHSLG